MNLTRTSIKNPAALLVIMTLLLVFGMMSLFSLPIQLIPDIQQPQINIASGWRNAAPEEVESVIIEPLENAVRSAPGVVETSTNIRRGFGNITLTYEVGTDMQAAMLEVINRLNQAPPLPVDALDPIISAGGGGQGGLASAASLLVRTTDDNPVTDISVYQKLIEDRIEPRLSAINGVAQVDLNSSRPEQIRITFDPRKAAALGISINTIRNRLAGATDSSGGFADVGRRQYTVRFAGQYQIEQIGQLIIAEVDGVPVHLNDIAVVERTLADRNGITLRNGAPAFYITIQRNNGANTVALVDEINVAIQELNQGELAAHGLQIDLSFDSSLHIRNALTLVKSNLGLGVILALAILWLFLRNWKATFIIALSIPFSVMLALLALNLMDRTINVISLAGIAFAVGLVLDAAIIVQENIVRLKNEGLEDKKAVLKGATQVTGALFASTATSVAIFLPILTMQGIEGQLFSDLALTLSVAVVASMLCAITIVPLVSKFALSKQVDHQDPLQRYWDKLSAKIMQLTDSHSKRLGWVASLMLGSVVIIGLMLPKTDFMPRAPIDGFFYSFNLPPGGNIEYLERELAMRVKERLAPYLNGDKQPAIRSYNFYTFGSNASGGFIYAADPTKVEELMTEIRTQVFTELPDTQTFLFRGSMINVAGAGNGRSVNIDLQGPDLGPLMQTAAAAITRINEAMPGVSAQPVPGLALTEPELRLIPDDRRLSDVGLTRAEMGNIIRAMTGGLFVSEYFDGNDRMNVILRAENWQHPDQLAALPVTTPFGGTQILSELAQVTRTVGPSNLRRINGQRTVSLILNPPEEVSLQEIMATLEEQVLPLIRSELPADASFQISGNANRMNQAIDDMLLNFVLAIFILFLLMTALFKSAKDSLLVLSVMPMAMAGGVISLWVLNLFSFQSLDLLTMIGFIILLGLVVNNAILLVDQTRQSQQQGLSCRDATEKAVSIRARPVYMSTLTSLFGMLPLMLVPGVGSEIYRGLATVIVGGMAVSALFTLILMPALLRLGESRQGSSKETLHSLTELHAE
ncbi:efflux RND transporter permease subunit [Lacimicrobium sp. SS2-24]|uniref:efflux RND transporter permease subunit n=1 Tax=Lacimicrobium sp. SS2-24 TaxID=2005569 RepID=UPI000B4BBAAE|nr:efflux RND transporter permease subunit [Lacimicrobium sp. SS2-24]